MRREIKGRSYANVPKQQTYVKYGDDLSYPTDSLKFIKATLIIDAMEEIAVHISDVPGAYLHDKIPLRNNVLLKLTDEFVDIMCEVNNEYTQHVRYEGRTKVF